MDEPHDRRLVKQVASYLMERYPDELRGPVGFDGRKGSQGEKGKQGKQGQMGLPMPCLKCHQLQIQVDALQLRLTAIENSDMPPPTYTQIN